MDNIKARHRHRLMTHKVYGMEVAFAASFLLERKVNI